MIRYQTRVYLHGLSAAFLNGLGTGFVAIVVDPGDFNLVDWAGFFNVAKMSIVAGAFGFFTYMKDHPLPVPEKDIDAVSASKDKIEAIKQEMDK
jgi:hypothetical protein